MSNKPVEPAAPLTLRERAIGLLYVLMTYRSRSVKMAAYRKLLQIICQLTPEKRPEA
jgi:hypothetical protein